MKFGKIPVADAEGVILSTILTGEQVVSLYPELGEQENPETGETVDYFHTPDGGGIHGIEWDDGNIWLTAFNPKCLILVDGYTYDVLQKFPCDLNVLHGLAKDGDGIWCSDRAEKVIAKFDKNSGSKIDEICLPDDGPDPHGLTMLNNQLWYSDADFPVAEVMRGYPEIGIIQR